MASKSLKYEICSICGKKWNVSAIKRKRRKPYTCPRCDNKTKGGK